MKQRKLEHIYPAESVKHKMSKKKAKLAESYRGSILSIQNYYNNLNYCTCPVFKNYYKSLEETGMNKAMRVYLILNAKDSRQELKAIL